jgi:hypothetical protein
MTQGLVRPDPLVIARHLRIAGRVNLGLWVTAWAAFAIAVAIRAASDVISALAVLICLFFAASFGLEATARRLELREIRAIIARNDLSAARSRGIPRVR